MTTNEKPVRQSPQKPAVGPRPRPPAGRAANAGPVRPAVTPVNSPAAIPAIMRGPVAPLSAGWRAAAAVTGTERPAPGKTAEPDDLELAPQGNGRVDNAAVWRPSTPGLSFRPIVQVADVAAAIVFYEHLGAEVIHGGPDTDYVLMQLGTVQIGLIARTGNAGEGAGIEAGSRNSPQGNARNACQGAVQLNFATAQPLRDLERHLRGRGVMIARGVHDTIFGPQLHVHTPDGLLIRIGQLEPHESV